MEKQSRKKSLGRRSSLPAPPPEPTSSSSTSNTQKSPSHAALSASPSIPDAIKNLLEYKEREKQFLKSMHENCSEKVNEGEGMETECESYINPLLNTTGPSVVAALGTHDAFEQLNKLHNMLFQFLSIKEQNDRMRRNARDLEMIYGLKKIQLKVSVILITKI